MEWTCPECDSDNHLCKCNTPFCIDCTFKDCIVSLDGTCEYIRDYRRVKAELKLELSMRLQLAERLENEQIKYQNCIKKLLKKD